MAATVRVTATRIMKSQLGVSGSSGSFVQGLTLAHFRAQLERFLWNTGCAQGLCSPCEGVLGGV